MENRSQTELETLLKEATKEVAYYKRLAREAGDTRLRETEELSTVIIARRQAEEALQKARNELEIRVEERTAELSRTNVFLKKEIVERERVEEALQKRLNYERMLADISTLVALSGDVNQFKSRCLELIGNTLDLCRVYIFEQHHGIDAMNNTFEWVAINEVSQKANLQGIPANTIPWWVKRLKGNQIINYKDIEDIPGEKEKEILRAQNIKSILIMPLFMKKKYYGFIGFDECRYHRDWLSEDIDILKTISQTITRAIESKTVADEVKESEKKYRTLFEDSLEAMSLTQKGLIVDVNPAWLKLHGLEEKYEVIGMSVLNFIYAEDHEILEKRRKLWPKIKKRIYQIRDIRKDGSTVDVEVYSSGTSFIGKEAILATVRDVTEINRVRQERKNLEVHLQRALKMEAIGTLAGGVAHDLNNVLSGIISYPELLLMEMSEDNPYRKHITKIQKSGEKAAAIVQDLLTLARRGVSADKVVNLDIIIREYLMSPEFEKLKQYHPKIRIETNLENKLSNNFGSPVHLSKTIMNLVSNAAEAMPDGGTISISTENRYIDRPINGYDNIEEGDYVVMKVQDIGAGIPPEELGNIFEPFYTKKVMGISGTGLGMTVVWGTVKDHNGYIDVQSKEGKGTTFTLYFPVTEREIARDEALLPFEDYVGKGESILVVDDIEDQREIASSILNKLGYNVVPVSSGEEAVSYMKKNSVDLLVLDMIMEPGIDGCETYKRILELHPTQKAIIASGFSETDRIKEAKKLGVGSYIRKPYTLENIGLAVKEELEK